MSNTSVKVWDLPTRLFHWTLVGLFGGAFAVAHLAGEHKPAFANHMLLGLILLAAIAFRLAWGFVGSRHARFASFRRWRRQARHAAPRCWWRAASRPRARANSSRVLAGC